MRARTMRKPKKEEEEEEEKEEKGTWGRTQWAPHDTVAEMSTRLINSAGHSLTRTAQIHVLCPILFLPLTRKAQIKRKNDGNLIMAKKQQLFSHQTSLEVK